MRSGYKRTEVGVIPEEWGLSTVGAEFEIQLGKMLDAEKNKGTLKPYLGNKAVQWDKIDITNLPLVAMSASDLRRFRLQRGDLLVCEGGEVARAAIWDAPIEECYYQKALHRLRPRRGYDARLLLAFLRYWTYRGILADHVTQTSIAHLPQEKLARLSLPAPKQEEQRAIATALSDVNDLISSLDKLIAKKRDVRQAAMQQLLTGRRRLPGLGGNWEHASLGSLVRVVGGGTPKTDVAEYWDGRIGWCTPSDVTACRGKYLSATARTITQQGLRASAAQLLPVGALLLCSRATIGEVRIAAIETCTNQGFKSLVCGDRVNNEYLYYAILMMKPRMVEKASGSTFLELSKKDTELLELPLPDLDEQVAIASVLSDMDAEIEALERRRDKTRLLKQGMMQELLTGRVRLV